MLICITVAFSLSMIKYLGDPNFLLTFLQNVGWNSLANSFENLTTINPNAELYRLVYWASNVIFFYVIPPFLLIKFVFKESFAEYGLSFKGAFKDNKIYIIMLLVMIPLVLFFSSTESFQARYPFYDLQKGEPMYPNLFIWEVVFRLRIFLQRIYGSWNKTKIWFLFCIRHDNSLLHDSFRKAFSRNHCRNYSRSSARNIEFEKQKHLVGSCNSLYCCYNDGFVFPLAERVTLVPKLWLFVMGTQIFYDFYDEV